jgi:hypothetical protein
MGLKNNKYVAKFIAGDSAPALPPTHEPDPTPLESPSDPSLPLGWSQEFDSTTQKAYYLERSTGRTQWVPPTNSHDPDAASILSGTTVGADTKPHQHDIVRRNHVYLNLPTAKEREEMKSKAEARRAERGEEKYVTALVVTAFVAANMC